MTSQGLPALHDIQHCLREYPGEDALPVSKHKNTGQDPHRSSPIGSTPPSEEYQSKEFVMTLAISFAASLASILGSVLGSVGGLLALLSFL
jgi:hypothetical protein